MTVATSLAFTGLSTINFTYPVELAGGGIDNAIVSHGVPERTGDLHQDQGSHSRTYEIEGICTIAELASLITMTETAQIATNGKATLTVTDAPGSQVFIVSQLTITNLRFKWPSGGRLRNRFNMKFVRTNQT